MIPAPALFLLLAFCAAIRVVESASAASVQGSAVQVPDGLYKIQSASGNFFQQFVDAAQNFFPGPGGNVAQVQLTQSAGGTEILSYSNSKCAAAQWVNSLHNNGFAAAYGCGNSGTGTVRQAKFEWFLVPVGGGGSSGISKAQSKVAVASSPNHPSGKHKSSGRRRGGRRHKRSRQSKESNSLVRRFEPEDAGLSKRGQRFGPYALVTSDHLHDLPPRAMTDQVGNAFGGQKGSVLQDFNPSDQSQWFYLEGV